MIQTLGMFLHFRKAKNIRQMTRVFLSSFYVLRFKSRNISGIWITVSKHGNPFGISYTTHTVANACTSPFTLLLIIINEV